MDMPMNAGAPAMAPDAPEPNPVAQQIADAAKQLPVDDLTTLMHGISPEALEVMEKIPELSAFANFIENAGSNQPDMDDQTDPNAPPGKPGVAIMIGVGKPKDDPRADIGRAMAQHGVR
jgi:hypothetical protein